jgi:hypothetical protein
MLSAVRVVSISDTYWSIYLPVNQQIDIKTKLQFFAHFAVDRLFSTWQGRGRNTGQKM